MNNVVFVDRDGTIVREPADKQVDSLEKLEFVPGIIAGLRLLTESGFRLVMATNQDGLGTAGYPETAFRLVQSKILVLLAGEGIRFEKVFVCPHLPRENCPCRKPKRGLVESYLKRHPVNPASSFVLGDRATDVLFARNLGIGAVRIIGRGSAGRDETRADYSTRDALDACRFIARAARRASVRRATNETTIDADVALDGSGAYTISTGIGFFDHMLAQLARHSSIDLTLRATGDLVTDEHHTVEDAGIVLGSAIRKALGGKRGINRFAFSAPLDEALAEVALDLSGRSYLSFRCDFRRERVGEFPTELVEDFFRAFADGLGATVHIACRGRNDHHKIEAIFKSVALALRSAVRIDDARRLLLPTTKGAL